MRKRLTVQTLVCLLLAINLGAVIARAQQPKGYDLQSPNGKIQIRIQTGERLTYDILVNGKMVLRNCRMSIDIDRKTLGLNPKVKAAKPGGIDREIEPVVRQKFAKVRENYKELRLEMEGNYAIVFRAYNEGVAYRLETSLAQPGVKVNSEEMMLHFAGDYSVYYPKEDSFFSHNQRELLYVPLHDIPQTST